MTDSMGFSRGWDMLRFSCVMMLLAGASCGWGGDPSSNAPPSTSTPPVTTPPPTPPPTPPAPPPPTPPPTVAPALSAVPASVFVGDSVTVSWTAPAGSAALDWIGLCALGASDRSPLWWQYTNGATSGSVAVPMSTPGDFEFRYFENDGYTKLATINVVTVSPP